MLRTEFNFVGSVLSLNIYMVLGTGLRSTDLQGKCLSVLIILSGPGFIFFKIWMQVYFIGFLNT